MKTTRRKVVWTLNIWMIGVWSQVEVSVHTVRHGG